MKTRTRKGGASKKPEPESSEPTMQQLEPGVQHPPHVFVWPKDTSPDARVVTLPNPATSTPERYLLCPDKGCFEFTRIAAPKRSCHSWLLAPDQRSEEGRQQEAGEGYILQTPDLMVATPIDLLFLVLPALATPDTPSMFLPPLDYVERLEERAPHLKQVLRQDDAGKLERMLQQSIESVSDTMKAADEELCKFVPAKLLERLTKKAKRMADRGLPASMENRFVKQALAVPVMTVCREESDFSMGDGADTAAGADSKATSESQAAGMEDAAAASTEAAAPPVPAARSVPSSTATPEILHLLRIRTALIFLLSSYIPPSLRTTLEALPSPIDFAPLDEHLNRISQLKQEAHALRSLSDNISRKRSAMDDEEAIEKAEAKKRKKEEEEARKKNVSQGVKKLAKADRSGMKSISSFFGAKPASAKK